MRRDPYAQLVEDAQQKTIKIEGVIDELEEETSSMDNVDEIIRKFSNKLRIQSSSSSYKERDLPTEPEWTAAVKEVTKEFAMKLMIFYKRAPSLELIPAFQRRLQRWRY